MAPRGSGPPSSASARRGSSTWSWPSAGHDFGGLVIPESAVVTEKADDATAQRFCEHIALHGVKVSGCNVGGADIRTREGVELTQRRIQFAGKWFGVAVVVSGAGQPADEAERRVVIDHLRRIGDTAGEMGITVALETHKGPTQNADAMLALMDELDHPHVRLNFDTGNIAYYNRGRRPRRRAREGQAPGPQRPPEGQPRGLRRLVLPRRRRRRERRLHAGPRDPRRRRLRRPLHHRDRGDRRRAASRASKGGKTGSRGASPTSAPAATSIESASSARDSGVTTQGVLRQGSEVERPDPVARGRRHDPVGPAA